MYPTCTIMPTWSMVFSPTLRTRWLGTVRSPYSLDIMQCVNWGSRNVTYVMDQSKYDSASYVPSKFLFVGSIFLDAQTNYSEKHTFFSWVIPTK